MKKKFVRIIAVLCCIIMAFSGCGLKGKNGGCADNSTRSLTHKISEEPLELTFFQSGAYVKQEQNIYSVAFDRTNVNLIFTAGDNITDFSQAMSLAIASKDLADILYAGGTTKINEYAKMEILVPLNDLIDQYAPNYKKFLEENPDVRQYTTSPDGNIYWIPKVFELEPQAGWFIRQDWLKKLGLNEPDTVDDFYNTLVAFKTKDPNGNGKADEVPYFSGQTDPVGVVNDFTGLFDARTTFRYENGKVTYGPLEPEFKQMMITIAKWYKEGLIDKEVFTRTKQREYFLGNDLGGVTHNWFVSTASYNGTFKDTVPGLEFKAFPPPTNSKGIKMETSKRQKYTGEGWAISIANEHPVETIKYFDYWWSEEGQRDATWGVEGVTYNMVDGQPQFTDLILKSVDVTPMQLLNEYRDVSCFGQYVLGGAELALAHPYAREGMDLYMDNGYYPVENVYLTYTEEENIARSKYAGQIKTYLAETIQNWILGNSDVEATYGNFVKELKSLGVDEYIAIEQAAYKRSLGN